MLCLDALDIAVKKHLSEDLIALTTGSVHRNAIP